MSDADQAADERLVSFREVIAVRKNVCVLVMFALAFCVGVALFVPSAVTYFADPVLVPYRFAAQLCPRESIVAGSLSSPPSSSPAPGGMVPVPSDSAPSPSSAAPSLMTGNTTTDNQKRRKRKRHRTLLLKRQANDDDGSSASAFPFESGQHSQWQLCQDEPQVFSIPVDVLEADVPYEPVLFVSTGVLEGTATLSVRLDEFERNLFQQISLADMRRAKHVIAGGKLVQLLFAAVDVTVAKDGDSENAAPNSVEIENGKNQLAYASGSFLPAGEAVDPAQVRNMPNPPFSSSTGKESCFDEETGCTDDVLRSMDALSMPDDVAPDPTTSPSYKAGGTAITLSDVTLLDSKNQWHRANDSASIEEVGKAPDLWIEWRQTGMGSARLQALILGIIGLGLMDVVPALVFFYVLRAKRELAAQQLGTEDEEDVLNVFTEEEKKALGFA